MFTVESFILDVIGFIEKFLLTLMELMFRPKRIILSVKCRNNRQYVNSEVFFLLTIILLISFQTAFVETRPFERTTLTFFATINGYLTNISITDRLLIFLPVFVIYRVAFYLLQKIVIDEDLIIVYQQLTLYLFSLSLITILIYFVIYQFSTVLREIVNFPTLLILGSLHILRYLYFIARYDKKNFSKILGFNIILSISVLQIYTLMVEMKFDEKAKEDNHGELIILNSTGNDTVNINVNLKERKATSSLLLLNQSQDNFFFKPSQLGELFVVLNSPSRNLIFSSNLAFRCDIRFENDSLQTLPIVQLQPGEYKKILVSGPEIKLSKNDLERGVRSVNIYLTSTSRQFNRRVIGTLIGN